MPILANCATLAALLTIDAPGSIIALTGTCDPIAITGRKFSPPVTIDATAATLSSVSLNGVSGLTWRGGTFSGAGKLSTAWSAGGSDHIAIENATMTGYLRNSIILGGSSDFRIVGNVMSHAGADGIDIAMSRRGLIYRNTCSDPDTTAGAHPDCVQLWSRPSNPPVSDIAIVGNTATGAMQGFSGFNHIRGGIDDGGFDRITVIDNTAGVAMPDGIYFTDCRSCLFVQNHFITPKGAAHWTNFTISGASSGSVAAADQTFEDRR